MKKSTLMKTIPLAVCFLTLLVLPISNQKEASFQQEEPNIMIERTLAESTIEKAEVKKQPASKAISAEQVTVTVRTPDGKPVEDVFVLFYPHMQENDGTKVIDREIIGFTNKEGVCTLNFKESKIKLVPGDTVTIMLGNTQIQEGSFKEQTVNIPYNSHPKFSLIWTEEKVESKAEQGKDAVVFQCIDEAGKPVEDLKITFRERDKVVPAGQAIVPSKINQGLMRVIGVTDEKGEYTFVEMPKANYRVSAEKEGKVKIYDVDITGQETKPIQLVWADFEF